MRSQNPKPPSSLGITLSSDTRLATARFSVLETVVTVIVAAGAVVYPIGFGQLVARVDLGSTNDFSTAWLVASLMPPVQVAGQGVLALAQSWPLLFFMVLAGLLASRGGGSETRSLLEFIRSKPWTFYVLILGLYAIGAAAVGLLTHDWEDAAVVGLGSIAVGLVWILIETRRARRALVQWILVIAVGYVGIAALSVIDVTQSHDPGLPHVDAGGYDGALVAHSDGYWYVLTTSGKLVAVPDTQATVVMITP
jgi:hypothetical protein